MSADAHRQAAQAHREQSDAHEGVYAGEVGDRQGALRPERHLAESQYHENVAEEHEAAAEALEHFEATECRGIDPATRAQCPFRGHVAGVDEIARGARVHLLEGESPERALAQMRCHVAFARTQGRQGMPSCPLYLPGVDVRMAPDGRSIDVTSDDASAVDEIRSRMRRHAVL